MLICQMMLQITFNLLYLNFVGLQFFDFGVFAQLFSHLQKSQLLCPQNYDRRNLNSFIVRKQVFAPLIYSLVIIISPLFEVGQLYVLMQLKRRAYFAVVKWIPPGSQRLSHHNHNRLSMTICTLTFRGLILQASVEVRCPYYFEFYRRFLPHFYLSKFGPLSVTVFESEVLKLHRLYLDFLSQVLNVGFWQVSRRVATSLDLRLVALFL